MLELDSAYGHVLSIVHHVSVELLRAKTRAKWWSVGLQ